MEQKILLWLFVLASSSSAYPQAGGDSTFLHAAVANTINIYKKTMGMQARLYNGSRYVPPDYTLEEHPYFRFDDWSTGDVFYDGEYFQDVPLMYDLQTDQLITEHLSSGQPIRLVWDKIQYFTIGGHHFRKISNATNGLPDTGLYDVLYAGPTMVVAKRQKLPREEIEAATIIRRFEERTRYFIFRDGAFHPVKTKTSVLNVLEDRKQVLKKLLKQQGGRFADNREGLLKMLAETYDMKP